MRMNLYSQNRHIVIVDGIPLSGFEDGDYIEWESKGNAAEITEGGDGPAMNLSVAQGGHVSIGLLPTSPLIGVLYALRDAQAMAPRLFSVVVMTGVEEVVRANGCGFGPLPSASTGGPTMKGRKFLFNALEIKHDVSAVEAIGGGFVGGLV